MTNLTQQQRVMLRSAIECHTVRAEMFAGSDFHPFPAKWLAEAALERLADQGLLDRIVSYRITDQGREALR